MALGMSTASVRAEVRRRDVRTVVKVAVEPSERLDGTRHESLDLILLGDVDFECLGNAAGGRDGLSRGTGAVDVQITDDDLASSLASRWAVAAPIAVAPPAMMMTLSCSRSVTSYVHLLYQWTNLSRLCWPCVYWR
jgi:hypothetical protein